uniref:Uncharacterized protein n=1 Tax=Arundo donax TaxID=35708 RepID=A0A0A8ZGY7_ARUDO
MDGARRRGFVTTVWGRVWDYIVNMVHLVSVTVRLSRGRQQRQSSASVRQAWRRRGSDGGRELNTTSLRCFQTHFDS